MEIKVTTDGEVFKSHENTSFGDVVELATNMLYLIEEEYGIQHAEKVCDNKDVLTRGIIELVNEDSGSRAECLFYLVATAADMLVTSFETLEKMKFEAELREM